jgi:hypothetical protein
MRETRTSGSMSGNGKRSAAHRPQATAPILDSIWLPVRRAATIPSCYSVTYAVPASLSACPHLTHSAIGRDLPLFALTTSGCDNASDGWTAAFGLSLFGPM